MALGRSPHSQNLEFPHNRAWLPRGWVTVTWEELLSKRPPSESSRVQFCPDSTSLRMRRCKPRSPVCIHLQKECIYMLKILSEFGGLGKHQNTACTGEKKMSVFTALKLDTVWQKKRWNVQFRHHDKLRTTKKKSHLKGQDTPAAFTTWVICHANQTEMHWLPHVVSKSAIHKVQKHQQSPLLCNEEAHHHI